MPTNLFGAGDNYDLVQGHVVAALIMKVAAAKRETRDTVELWGSGKPLREFLFADDMADGLVFLMKNYSGEEHVNVGTGKDITVSWDWPKPSPGVAGWKGHFTFDASRRPDGTPAQGDGCVLACGHGLDRQDTARRGAGQDLSRLCGKSRQTRSLKLVSPDRASRRKSHHDHSNGFDKITDVTQFPYCRMPIAAPVLSQTFASPVCKSFLREWC